MFRVFRDKQGLNQKIFESGLIILKGYCYKEDLDWNEWEREAVTSISDCFDNEIYDCFDKITGVRK